MNTTFNSTIDRIQAELGSNYECRIHGPLVLIRTPFTFPDNDLIDVYYMPSSSALVDLGETLRWLHSIGKEGTKLMLPPDIRLYKGVLRLYNCQPTKKEVEHLALTIKNVTTIL
jgi:hypothetical protein